MLQLFLCATAALVAVSATYEENKKVEEKAAEVKTDSVAVDDKTRDKRELFSFGHGFELFDEGYKGFQLDSLGGYDEPEDIKSITITKEVPVLRPVYIDKKIPFAVKVPVDRPYPVHFEKQVPVSLKVPVPHLYPVHVDKEIPYSVHLRSYHN